MTFKTGEWGKQAKTRSKKEQNILKNIEDYISKIEDNIIKNIAYYVQKFKLNIDSGVLI